MKIPSLTFLLQHAKRAFLRFPFSLLSAGVGVTVAIYMVECFNELDNAFPCINLLLSAALGVPLFFSVGILLENRDYSSIKKASSYGLALLLLGSIYYSLPDSSITNNTYVPYIRYTIFNLIAHLVVSFIPYLKTAQLNGFWNYNKTLFLRFCGSLLYSIVLYIGIALALTALDLLFDIDLHEELYAEIFIVIVGLFNTWYFVSGIPNDLNALDQVTTYPKGLKIFTQYVLLPLLVLYLLILYGYGGKILILSDWPKGIVAYLISGVSTLGIFTLLLIYPYGKEQGNTWIRKFTSLYYYLLFPLIVFLFIAVSIRINDYGLTINRYIIVLLGIWLSLVAIYFSIKKTNIKFIPISLATILALMSFGPWGMFSLSERSQVNRLKAYLEEGGILVNETIQNEPIWTVDSTDYTLSASELLNDKKLSDSIHNGVMSIMNYLENNHGFSSIQAWFNQNIDSLYKVSLDSNRYLNEAKIYMNSMGFSYRHFYQTSPYSKQYNNFHSELSKVKIVSDYDLFTSFRLNDHLYNSHQESFSFDDNILCITRSDSLPAHITIQYNESVLPIQVDSLIQRLHQEHKEESDKTMVLSASSEQLEVKIMLKHLNYYEENDTLKLNQMSGDLYLKLVDK